mmetsp:Transcript_7828/g.29304  ORF Transcript_7828/g.29304 Transcript_7828/m.29304 type:complete len:283 (+) Transcript_7828:585-1433(+)
MSSNVLTDQRASNSCWSPLQRRTSSMSETVPRCTLTERWCVNGTEGAARTPNWSSTKRQSAKRSLVTSLNSATNSSDWWNGTMTRKCLQMTKQVPLRTLCTLTGCSTSKFLNTIHFLRVLGLGVPTSAHPVSRSSLSVHPLIATLVKQTSNQFASSNNVCGSNNEFTLEAIFQYLKAIHLSTSDSSHKKHEHSFLLSGSRCSQTLGCSLMHLGAIELADVSTRAEHISQFLRIHQLLLDDPDAQWHIARKNGTQIMLSVAILIVLGKHFESLGQILAVKRHV